MLLTYPRNTVTCTYSPFAQPWPQPHQWGDRGDWRGDNDNGKARSHGRESSSKTNAPKYTQHLMIKARSFALHKCSSVALTKTISSNPVGENINDVSDYHGRHGKKMKIFWDEVSSTGC